MRKRLQILDRHLAAKRRHVLIGKALKAIRKRRGRVATLVPPELAALLSTEFPNIHFRD